MIRVDLSKCTGCHRCETYCSFYHSGAVSHTLSRIRVINLYEIGIDGPVTCQQCSERYCLSCPVKALSIGELGQIIASPTVCTQCGACEINCPIGAIRLQNEIVYVCDLCGGQPRCVEACTEGAIVFTPLETEVISLSKFKPKSTSLNSSEKQAAYIRIESQDLRTKWRLKNG